MKIKVWTISPCHWTREQWEMSDEEREKIGIKLVEFDYKDHGYERFI